MNEQGQFEYIPEAPTSPQGPSVGVTKTSPMAVTAFVLSLVFIIPFLPLIGSVLGIISVATIKPHQGGKGLAIAAIPVGLVCLLLLQGIMAAVAIPAFIDYIRKSKASEVHMNLNNCYHGVVSYFDSEHQLANGTPVVGVLPRSTAMVCAGGVSGPEGLSGESAFVEVPESARAAFADLGWEFNERSYACFRYHSDAAGAKPADGDTITCEGWTDLDDDDKPAHWVLRATYRADKASFVRDNKHYYGADEEYDDW
jgi:hypothetical protein